MPFPSLPLEILQQITTSVETVHRPSLFAFSLTSKACHRASAFLVFRQINVTVHHREGLRRDIDKLVEALSRTDSARHVQCISIKGDIRLKPKTKDDSSNYLRSTGLDEILVDYDPMSYHRHYVVYDEPVIKKSSEEDRAWAPVVSLLHAIPHLKDLVYNCQSQFPPSLLRTLHEQHARCRLHHLSFLFRTLLWGTPYPYEMELATSPSLYRVKLISSLRDSDYDDDFNEEALMEVAAGLAPNLKEVMVVNVWPYRSGRDFRVREPWQGLPSGTGGVLGSLESLSIRGYSHLTSPTLLQNWATHTNFACLRHLALGGGYETQSCALSGETMQWMAQNHSFPQLRTLSVYIKRDDMMEEQPHYSSNAVSFFQAFNALEELTVNGPMDAQILNAILSHHGQTLTKLCLCPLESPFNAGNGRDRRDIPMEFSADQILQIQAQCLVLEELALPIKRNKSSASEAEMYRCFALMQRLRFLFLTLDCSNWRVHRDSTYNPQFDGEDQEPVHEDHWACVKKGVLKECFINCAVDEALARSIWTTIAEGKTGRRLERLRLWTTGADQQGGQVWAQGACAIIKDLSRSWLIERVPRDDRDDITVKELGRYAREFGDPYIEQHVRECSKSRAGEVFRTIWPCKASSKDWRDDWSSFPLQAAE